MKGFLLSCTLWLASLVMGLLHTASEIADLITPLIQAATAVVGLAVMIKAAVKAWKKESQ